MWPLDELFPAPQACFLQRFQDSLQSPGLTGLLSSLTLFWSPRLLQLARLSQSLGKKSPHKVCSLQQECLDLLTWLCLQTAVTGPTPLHLQLSEELYKGFLHTPCLLSTQLYTKLEISSLPSHFEISKIRSPIRKYQDPEKVAKAVFPTQNLNSTILHSARVQTLCPFPDKLHSDRGSSCRTSKSHGDSCLLV